MNLLDNTILTRTPYYGKVAPQSLVLQFILIAESALCEYAVQREV